MSLLGEDRAPFKVDRALVRCRRSWYRGSPQPFGISGNHCKAAGPWEVMTMAYYGSFHRDMSDQMIRSTSTEGRKSENRPGTSGTFIVVVVY